MSANAVWHCNGCEGDVGECDVLRANASLAAVEAVLPATCYVTRDTDLTCADLIGGTFPQGEPFLWEMACLPCRVRNALSATVPDAGRGEAQEPHIEHCPACRREAGLCTNRMADEEGTFVCAEQYGHDFGGFTGTHRSANGRRW